LKGARTVRERLSESKVKYLYSTMIWFVISLLSMGAVFAIFAAYYNWSPLMTGYKYNELLANIQFWTFFIGVNLLFFPMHFLGLSGMARRIPDYPDVFSYWNYIASSGSIITLFSVFLFIYILFNQLLYKIPANYSYSSYFLNIKFNYIKYYNPNIEFILSFPPNYHTYNILPIL
jgi:cytochrome c oxidase subunit 1